MQKYEVELIGHFAQVIEVEATSAEDAEEDKETGKMGGLVNCKCVGLKRRVHEERREKVRISAKRPFFRCRG